ncbi:MAG: hypothetical protein AAFN93_01750 [Bacteroidota bacterium]
MNSNEAIENIIFKNDYKLLSESIQFLHEKYSSITGIAAGDMSTESYSNAAFGQVVSPIIAAHCLIDLERTRQFLRGIYLAINDQLQHKEQVKILYAGCGPYATLITPLIILYHEKDLSITLMDINATSLSVVKKLYNEEGLEGYIERYVEADATIEGLNLHKTYDIIISETMQAGLKKESQVALTKNLAKFLNKDGVFIPERITLDVFACGQLQDISDPLSEERMKLGTAYNFDSKNLPAPDEKIMLDIPDNEMTYLKLFTTIHVYASAIIKENQSGLTVPLVIDRWQDNSYKKLCFWYDEATDMELKFEYIL